MKKSDILHVVSYSIEYNRKKAKINLNNHQFGSLNKILCNISRNKVKLNVLIWKYMLLYCKKVLCNIILYNIIALVYI